MISTFCYHAPVDVLNVPAGQAVHVEEPTTMRTGKSEGEARLKRKMRMKEAPSSWCRCVCKADQTKPRSFLLGKELNLHQRKS